MFLARIRALSVDIQVTALQHLPQCWNGHLPPRSSAAADSIFARDFVSSDPETLIAASNAGTS